MRKTRKQNGGGGAEEVQRRIDKWVADGDVDKFLDLSNLNLTSLPTLPDNLKKLNCTKNNLTTLPKLPITLTSLFCFSNELTILPSLPNGLLILFCTHNKLTRLPSLPNGLGILYCSNNELTRLPKLPDSLEDLLCENNNLPSIFYMIEGEEEVEIGVRRNYINRIRKLQKSKKNIVNTLKSHTTEKKRNNLANRNSKYPRNVMKSIANYMNEEDLENININSLKPRNVKRGETKKLKKV